MIFDQTLTQYTIDRRKLHTGIPGSILRFIEKWIEQDEAGDIIIVKKISDINFLHAVSIKGSKPVGHSAIVCLKSINTITHINSFLKTANQKLRKNGLFIGCIEPNCGNREQSFSDLLKWPFGKAANLIKSSIRGAIKNSRSNYFFPEKTGRVISEMETYGRLFASGFQISETSRIGNKIFFVGKKAGLPDTRKVSTGLIIGLNRVGLNGKPIKVYKLRTMFPYSEYVQEYIFKQNGLSSSCKFKDDPRVTPKGRYLRKYWIDEIPMLYNLLRGDVKIFGVRPLSPHYYSLFPEAFRKYRSRFKPGLIPPLYVELPRSLEDILAIEQRYLKAYEQNPLWTDLTYTFKALYNIFIKKVRSQ